MRIFGLILAGGGGRRMGSVDKAMLRLAGQPLVVHVAERLEPQVELLALSANGDPARLGFLGLTVLADAVSQGPLSGVLAGLDWAEARGAEALVTAPVDAPFLPGDLVPRLLLAGMPAVAVAARPHPTFALWPVALRDDLRGWLAGGGSRLREFAERHGAAPARFPEEEEAFLNLNTPEDLAAAEALLR